MTPFRFEMWRNNLLSCYCFRGQPFLFCGGRGRGAGLEYDLCATANFNPRLQVVFCVFPHIHFSLTLSVQASLSVCKFSLCNPHKIGCLEMRIKEAIIHSNYLELKTNSPNLHIRKLYSQFRRIQQYIMACFGLRGLTFRRVQLLVIARFPLHSTPSLTSPPPPSHTHTHNISETTHSSKKILQNELQLFILFTCTAYPSKPKIYGCPL